MASNKWKYNIDYNIDDIYKHYHAKQIKNNKPVTEKIIFKKIINYFNKEICRNIVEKSVEYRLPYRLGYLRIRKHKTRLIVSPDGKLKTNHMYPNWEATKNLWKNNEEARKNKKIVFHTNDHTNKFYYKWYWDKRACNIRNSSVYSIIMSRTNKRLIAKAIKNNDKIDYYE